MRYLFFDTESSNCFDGLYKMCEFGCVAVDSKFNVLPGTKKDILLNPGKDGKFNLTGRKDGRDLILAHPYEEYKKAHLFDALHDNISFLLGQKDMMVFLWASENDIQALLDQCSRYRFPKISFVSYDVQLLFKMVMPELKEMPSLEKAAALLNIELSGMTPHRPDDDSLMTMLILKALCEKTGKTPLDLVRECPECEMESAAAYTAMKKRHMENVARRAAINKKKAEFAPLHEELNKLLSMDIPEGTPKEKQFAVSLETKVHVDETLPLIKKWVANGFFLKRNLNVAYLIAFNEKERERLKKILDTSQLQILLIEEFEKLCASEA